AEEEVVAGAAKEQVIAVAAVEPGGQSDAAVDAHVVITCLGVDHQPAGRVKDSLRYAVDLHLYVALAAHRVDANGVITRRPADEQVRAAQFYDPDGYGVGRGSDIPGQVRARVSDHVDTGGRRGEVEAGARAGAAAHLPGQAGRIHAAQGVAGAGAAQRHRFAPHGAGRTID